MHEKLAQHRARWRGLTARRRATAQAGMWFAGTYAGVRTLRYLQVHKVVKGGSGLQVHGEQIHHYVWGLVLLILQGVGGTLFDLDRGSLRQAAPFGAGLALVLEEFDVLLNADEWYWAQAGRPWLDAGVSAAGLILAGLVSKPLWENQPALDTEERR